MRKLLAALSTVALAGGLTLTAAGPASATVHEIVAQWCSGQDELGPPGISGGSNADNFARPLFANGFLSDPVPFNGPNGPGLLIPFDYDHPASKVVGSGVFIQVDTTPAGPLYIELIEPNPEFAAFARCPRLDG